MREDSDSCRLGDKYGCQQRRSRGPNGCFNPFPTPGPGRRWGPRMAATDPARARVYVISGPNHFTEVLTGTIPNGDSLGFDRRGRWPSAAESKMDMKLRARGVSESLGPVSRVGSATAARLSAHRSTLWSRVEGGGSTSSAGVGSVRGQPRLGRTGVETPR